MAWPMRRLAWFTIGSVVAAFVACSSTESGTIGLIEGPGGPQSADDPFTEPACPDGGTQADAFCGPAPTTIKITDIVVSTEDGGGDAAGPVNTLAQEPYGADGGATLTLPSVSSDDILILQATAFDSMNKPVIFGQTIPVDVGGIDGITLNLFVQRMGQFARMPSPFTIPQMNPLATVFEGRYILVADGANAVLYDLLLWGLSESADGGSPGITLPCVPATMAPIPGTSFMFIVCTEDASTNPAGTCPDAGAPAPGGDLIAWDFDVSGVSCTTPAELPSGTNQWRDIAFGSTVTAPNGDTFVVGATRSANSAINQPTTAVLRLSAAEVSDAEAGSTNVTPSFINLNTARVGATAVWVGGQYGLAVVGGEQSDGTPAGIETAVDSDGGTSPFATLTGAPNNLPENAGVVALSPTQILIAGGTYKGAPSATRLIDFSAGTATMASDAGANTALPLTSAQGFLPAGATSPIFIGPDSDDNDFTHAFLVLPMSPFTSTEVPFHVSNRTNTTAVLSPLPSVVVIGGDVTMESYIGPNVP
jgi:hypothetical protein